MSLTPGRHPFASRSDPRLLHLAPLPRPHFSCPRPRGQVPRRGSEARKMRSRMNYAVVYSGFARRYAPSRCPGRREKPQLRPRSFRPHVLLGLRRENFGPGTPRMMFLLRSVKRIHREKNRACVPLCRLSSIDPREHIIDAFSLLNFPAVRSFSSLESSSSGFPSPIPSCLPRSFAEFSTLPASELSNDCRGLFVSRVLSRERSCYLWQDALFLSLSRQFALRTE